jgi:chemotaxis protein MotB
LISPHDFHEEEERSHGGAWKVAYADFVTALMALFIVLWLMSAGPEVREAVSAYFRHPKGFAEGMGSGKAGAGQGVSVGAITAEELKGRLEKAIQAVPAFQRIASYVHFTVTGEGLRIELSESAGGVFFDSASPNLTQSGESVFRTLANELTQLPNEVAIEGHSDARPFRNGWDGYGNWELSFDRANAARRLMLTSGLKEGRIVSITGYADRRPISEDATDSRNRRVSVVVRYAGQ